ncbi:MAG: RNase H family protein [Thermoguttaceae bacterium]|jgi:ribonuclease HI
MNAAPHYLLFSEASKESEPGHWRFVLRAADGTERLVVDDVEPDVRGERLELLTVVRGLEALDQPSEVTIFTSSVYVRKGIEYGIAEWRKNDWEWEFFGEMVPVKDNDLWQRLDHATRFHRLKCRTVRFDPPHASPRPAGRSWASPKQCPVDEIQPTSDGLRDHWQSVLTACCGLIQEAREWCRERLDRARAGFAPAFGLIRLF